MIQRDIFFCFPSQFHRGIKQFYFNFVKRFTIHKFSGFFHSLVPSATWHLNTFRHDVAEALECNLFRNILCFDAFILFSDDNQFTFIFPAVLFDPVSVCII